MKKAEQARKIVMKLEKMTRRRWLRISLKKERKLCKAGDF